MCFHLAAGRINVVAALGTLLRLAIIVGCVIFQVLTAYKTNLIADEQCAPATPPPPDGVCARMLCAHVLPTRALAPAPRGSAVCLVCPPACLPAALSASAAAHRKALLLREKISIQAQLSSGDASQHLSEARRQPGISNWRLRHVAERSAIQLLYKGGGCLSHGYLAARAFRSLCTKSEYAQAG